MVIKGKKSDGDSKGKYDDKQWSGVKIRRGIMKLVKDCKYLGEMINKKETDKTI